MKFEKYRLNTEVTNEALEKNGFKKNTYRKHIYKNLIDFVLGVNPQNGEWYYQILDSNTGMMYVPYYNRTFGKNIVVEKLDKEVEKIFSKMKRNKIFISSRKVVTNDK